MMNIDQARAGGEGIVGVKKKPEDEDKKVEMEEDSPIFQSDEKKLRILVPDGWSVSK
jgi:hypothetical protein